MEGGLALQGSVCRAAQEAWAWKSESPALHLVWESQKPPCRSSSNLKAGLYRVLGTGAAGGRLAPSGHQCPCQVLLSSSDSAGQEWWRAQGGIGPEGSHVCRPVGLPWGDLAAIDYFWKETFPLLIDGPPAAANYNGSERNDKSTGKHITATGERH